MTPGAQASALALMGLVVAGLAFIAIGTTSSGTAQIPASRLSWAARIGVGSSVDAPSAALPAPLPSAVTFRASAGRPVDVASCTEMGGDLDSCVKVVDLVKIVHAAGEPLVETQIGPVLAALSAAQARLPVGRARPVSSDSREKIRQMQQDLATIAERNATFQRSVDGVLSPSQLKHFEHYLDEEREMAQVDLDVALENAARK